MPFFSKAFGESFTVTTEGEEGVGTEELGTGVVVLAGVGVAVVVSFAVVEGVVVVTADIAAAVFFGPSDAGTDDDAVDDDLISDTTFLTSLADTLTDSSTTSEGLFSLGLEEELLLSFLC